jgi:hypothetical protein
VGVIEGRSIEGDVVVEGVALERQQHQVTPSQVLGGRDAEDGRHQGPDVLDANSLTVEVADGGSLERDNCGGCLPWCCCWCCSSSRMRWRCSNSEDGSELELEGGRDSSRLLGLGGDDARPKVVAACSCCDAASTATARSQEAAAATWTVVRVVAKSDGATPETANATAMVSGVRMYWVYVL